MAIRLNGVNGRIDGFDETYFGGGFISTGGSLSRGNSGYVSLEGGFKMQYGSATSTGTGGRNSSTVYCPIAFGAQCLTVVMCEAGASGWGSDFTAATLYCPTTITNSYFQFQAAWVTTQTSYYSSGLGGFWIAIGY